MMRRQARASTQGHGLWEPHDPGNRACFFAHRIIRTSRHFGGAVPEWETEPLEVEDAIGRSLTWAVPGLRGGFVVRTSSSAS
jgi:hypothetical protein